MGGVRKSKHDIKNRVIKADNSFFRVRRNKLLSTQEHRLFSYALNKMQNAKENLIKRDSTKPDTELVTAEIFNKIREVEFELDEFLSIFGIERRSFISKIDTAIIGLKQFEIIIEKYREEKTKNKLISKAFYSVLSFAEYNTDNNKVYLSFNYDTRDLFCNLHNSRIGFTAVNLIETFEMTSNYAVALYEYFKSFLERKDVKKSGELTIKYEELRKVLAVPDTEYALFADFKRKVLEMAKIQINANKNSVFDIDFALKKSGKGGKVTDIIFTIKKRTRTAELQKRIMAPVVPVEVELSAEEQAKQKELQKATLIEQRRSSFLEIQKMLKENPDSEFSKDYLKKLTEKVRSDKSLTKQDKDFILEV